MPANVLRICCVWEFETAFLSLVSKATKKRKELQMRHQPKYNKYAVGHS